MQAVELSRGPGWCSEEVEHEENNDARAENGQTGKWANGRMVIGIENSVPIAPRLRLFSETESQPMEDGG